MMYLAFAGLVAMIWAVVELNVHHYKRRKAMTQAERDAEDRDIETFW